MCKINHLPQSINTSINKLEHEPLPLLIREGVYSNPSRVRGIRSDFVRNIKKVLIFLIRHYDIVTKQLVFPVGNNEYVSITPAIIAERTNLCSRTIKRILKYFLQIGIISKEEQRKPVQIHTLNGDYIVLTSILRKIEDKFFAIIGTLNLLKSDRTGRLNRLLIVKRQKATRFILHTREEQPRPKPKTTPPQPQRGGPTSLKDLFRRAKERGIPIPEYLL